MWQITGGREIMMLAGSDFSSILAPSGSSRKPSWWQSSLFLRLFHFPHVCGFVVCPILFLKFIMVKIRGSV